MFRVGDLVIRKWDPRAYPSKEIGIVVSINSGYEEDKFTCLILMNNQLLWFKPSDLERFI